MTVIQDCVPIDYVPIDYRTYSLEGKGYNIIADLDILEKRIWDASFPFQDKRQDTGHAETVTYFALKLTKILGGDREITIPAAILHDTGWSQMTQTELDLFYINEWERYEPVLRARHQETGSGLAKTILSGIGNNDQNSYTLRPDQIDEISEIISQHDTRKGFCSNNDGIVRDADKLWRFTKPCLQILIDLRGSKNMESAIAETSKAISREGFFYSPISAGIAMAELDNVRKSYSS